MYFANVTTLSSAHHQMVFEADNADINIRCFFIYINTKTNVQNHLNVVIKENKLVIAFYL